MQSPKEDKMSYIVSTEPVSEISAIVEGEPIWEPGSIKGVLLSEAGVVILFEDKEEIHKAIEDMVGHDFQDVDELLGDLGWEAVALTEAQAGKLRDSGVGCHVDFEMLSGDPVRVQAVETGGIGTVMAQIDRAAAKISARMAVVEEHCCGGDGK